MLATQIRRTGAALLAAAGILHLALVPEYLHEKTYVGLLFVVGGTTAAGAAARLWAGHDLRAWTLGGLTAAGMAAGFILSRVTGLPGFHPTDWELSGIVSALLEAGFIVALVRFARLTGLRGAASFTG